VSGREQSIKEITDQQAAWVEHLVRPLLDEGAKVEECTLVHRLDDPLAVELYRYSGLESYRLGRFEVKVTVEPDPLDILDPPHG
jgi:hypothetical protein